MALDGISTADMSTSDGRDLQVASNTGLSERGRKALSGTAARDPEPDWSDPTLAERQASQERLVAAGRTARATFELRTEAAPAPVISNDTARDWTPAELAVMDRGARNGAAMAGKDAVVEVVTGAITAAATAGQAAIVGVDHGAQILSWPGQSMG